MINYVLHIIIISEIFALFAVGLQLQIGDTGLYNFGHVAFFGLGAYASALLTVHGVPFLVSLVLSLGIAGGIAWLVGFPILRLRGDYFGLAMLGFAEIMRKAFLNEAWLTRGPMGIPGIPRPSFFGFTVKGLPGFAVLYGGLLLLAFLFVHHVVRSPLGRVFHAIRDDEYSATAVGKDTFRLRRVSLVIGTLLAALGGVLWAHYITFISPSDFTLNETILVLLIVVLGSGWGIPGSILATFLVIGFQEGLRFLPLPESFGRIVAPVQQMAFGLVLILLVMRQHLKGLGKGEQLAED